MIPAANLNMDKWLVVINVNDSCMQLLSPLIINNHVIIIACCIYSRKNTVHSYLGRNFVEISN